MERVLHRTDAKGTGVSVAGTYMFERSQKVPKRLGNLFFPICGDVYIFSNEVPNIHLCNLPNRPVR